jgi:hypothetical protein
MEIKFYREKEERKALVKAIGEILGLEPVYKGAPSFGYVVGDYTIDRYGTLGFDMGSDEEAVQRLLAELSARGFTGEGDIHLTSFAHAIPEPAGDSSVTEVAAGEEVTSQNEEPNNEDSPNRTAIEVPLAGFTPTALENLQRLVSGKAVLIMKALGVDALPIEQTETLLRFPWFAPEATEAEVDAYAVFVHALCELAKKQKRVTLTEKPIDPNASEKFAFRCFLLRLGFIGKDEKIASARKVLLSKLSGNGSFKAGDHKKRTAADKKPADVSGGMLAPVVADAEPAEPAEPTAGASVPLRCQDCHHHSYCTDGILRTSTGDLVDTSKRTPDNYTHYCLGVPSGYRKLKHATDWSGGETPPKWCPLAVQGSESDVEGHNHSLTEVAM